MPNGRGCLTAKPKRQRGRAKWEPYTDLVTLTNNNPDANSYLTVVYNLKFNHISRTLNLTLTLTLTLTNRCMAMQPLRLIIVTLAPGEEYASN